MSREEEVLAGTALCTGPGDPGVAQGMAPAAGLELHHTGAAGPHGGHRGGIPPGPLREPAEAPLRKVPDTARVLCCPSFLQSWRGCRRGPGADTRPVLPPTFLPSLLAMPLSPVAFCLFPVGGGGGGGRRWSEAGVATFALRDAVHERTDTGNEAPSGPSPGL